MALVCKDMSLSTLKPCSKNIVTIKKKVEVIEAAKSDPTLSVRKLMEFYQCGRTDSCILRENQ